MFNVFSDPGLKVQQDQMQSQWLALYQTVENCGLSPSSGPAFQQFYGDYNSWREFYDSGSDWTTASRNTTNDWQRKLQEHTSIVGKYCSVGFDGSSPYLPTVEDPPPDTLGFADELKKLANKPFDLAEKFGTLVAVVIVVAVVLVAAMIFYALKRGVAVSPEGGKIG